MRVNARVLVVAFLSWTAVACHAQSISSPATRQVELARQLVELLEFKQMFANYLKSCVAPDSKHFDPKAVFASDPGHFGGISPQSSYWPDVVDIYRRFQADV